MNGINSNDLKVGLLIWWTAERYMKDWSCPGIVTEVDFETETYKVFTFDDMKETTDLSFRNTKHCCGSDPSSLTEMEIITKDRLISYLNEQRNVIDAKMKALESKMEALKKEVPKLTELINNIENNNVLRHLKSDAQTIVN